MWAADSDWAHSVAIAVRADYLAAKYDEPHLYEKAAILWEIADMLLAVAIDAAKIKKRRPILVRCFQNV